VVPRERIVDRDRSVDERAALLTRVPGPFHSWDESLTELGDRRERAQELGGQEGVARQHASGKLTIRERLSLLTDSFREVGTLATTNVHNSSGEIVGQTPSGYVCGLAVVDGRKMAVGGEDFTVRRGAPTTNLDRIKGGMGGFVEDLAHEYRIPMALLVEGVGGDVSAQDVMGHAYLPSMYSFTRCFELLAEVPVVAAVLGPTAGITAARAAISHFSVMTKKACLFAGGPPLVQRAMGQEISKEELGGWEVHARGSGLVDNLAQDDEDAIRQLRTVLSYLPQNVWELPPVADTDDPPDRSCDALLELMPESRRRAYDMKRILAEVVDRGSFFEIGGGWGRSLVTGLGRIAGQTVGMVGNNPKFIGGALDAAAADKQVRFLDLCSTFHIPIAYFVDVPGFMIGPQAEREATLRHGARAIGALFRNESPVVTIHVRKAFGMAVNATSNPDRLGLRLAWPSVEIGDMPIEGGVEATYRREIAAAEDPDAFRAEVEARMLEDADPWKSVEAFAVEEFIDPRETRAVLADFFSAARSRLGTTLGPPTRQWIPSP
jgi:acetyl-CoA carboxylase carboxyltransferase component